MRHLFIVYWTGYSPLLVRELFLLCSNYHKQLHRYAYFHNLPQADLPYIKIPLHTVIKLTPKAYGCDEERFDNVLYTIIVGSHFSRYTLPIGAVDTHRPKPGATQQVPSIPGTGREYFGEQK